MVSEGKEQAIRHLDKADLAFIAVLIDIQADQSDSSKNIYQLTFENIQMVRGELLASRHFEYQQSPKKVEDEPSEELKQAAAEDDEVKEAQEGKTYLAILTDPEHILVLIEIQPNDIQEILQSSHERNNTTIGN